MPERILFVCTANIDRSATAEDLLRGDDSFEVLSAGTWLHARRKISRELLDWADKIFVMEEHHKDAVLDLKPDAENKIILLDIPDAYPKSHPELVKTLKAKLSKHLNIEW